MIMSGLIALTIVSVNGRHFCILLYSILICIVLCSSREVFSQLVAGSFQFEEKEFGTYRPKYPSFAIDATIQFTEISLPQRGAPRSTIGPERNPIAFLI